MKKIATFIIFTTISLNIMAQQKIVQTAGRTQLGEFAPEFAHLNDDILFGEVWSRNDLLSLRDRSLVTITSLISQGITDNSLKYHLQSAKNNGITRTEAAEIITHIAFYAGWPKAWAAFNLAKEVWNEDVKGEDAKAAFQREMIFPAILAIIIPIIVGVILGVAGVLGLLVGGLAGGFTLAVFMANAGGAWDNAKKYVEEGNYGGKGYSTHKATVVGDTVGDPFKDTSGPSLNILIKLMSMVSIVMAGLTVAFI